MKNTFTKMNKKDFRVLMFYPNLHMSALMPQSIGIFTALLRDRGYTLDLFDCTYYEDIDELTLGRNTNQEKVENRNVRTYNNKEWIEKGVKPKRGIVRDFVKKVEDFQPNLIITSVLESTYFLALKLLGSVDKKKKKLQNTFWRSVCYICNRKSD